jgi:AhpD family alkylhydroperoxidase
MTKSYTDITASINKGIAKLRDAQPDAMSGFMQIAKGAMKSGALSEMNKELIALAIGVAGHCDGCIGFHAKALARLKTPRDQLMETLAVARLHGRRSVADVRGGRHRRPSRSSAAPAPEQACSRQRRRRPFTHDHAHGHDQPRALCERGAAVGRHAMDMGRHGNQVVDGRGSVEVDAVTQLL